MKSDLSDTFSTPEMLAMTALKQDQPEFCGYLIILNLLSKRSTMASQHALIKHDFG